MPSTFSWLDHSDADRRRVLDAIEQFKESDTRDELGLGPLRDGFADLFFPGTSTIQTRARYFLFVPWIYQRLEKQGVGERIGERVRKEEIKLMDALLASGERDGVVGRVGGASTKRLPSSLYWFGLSVLGIRRFRGSQEQYHRRLAQPLRDVRDVLRDDDGDSVDDSGSHRWQKRLPSAPPDFPAGVSFALTADEAQYLAERICIAAPQSPMAYLVRHGRTLEAEYPWSHPQFAEFPSETRGALRHAQLLAETMHGASLLYNLMLSEELPHGEVREQRVADYRSALQKWHAELHPKQDELRRWDREEFWRVAHAVAHVRQSTRQFIDRWIEIALWVPGVLGEGDQSARALIKERELRLKGKGRARLGNPRALENWSGYAGTGRLSYRWGPAVRILSDIHAGLGGTDA
jgi:hypothetical protein